MPTEPNNKEDILDVRDIIARFEELETELQEAHEGQGDAAPFDEWLEAATDDDKHTLQDAAIEFCDLRNLLTELEGNGGDEQWRGSWYPITLVRDTYFEDFAQEEAEQCGLIVANAHWPNNCIDWEEAARQLKQDYTSVEFDGITYWHRS